MSAVQPPPSVSAEVDQSCGVGRTAYGEFSPSGDEYRIYDYCTPRPWVNVIANSRLGFVVSQTGSGFTWIDNSQLAVLTRWQQDLAYDASGKFLYLRDADADRLWSLSPAPTWPRYDRFVCRHALGFTTFETELEGIRARWTLLADVEETVELWRVELENLSARPRRLELTAALEWNCGVAPSPRREFQKLFIETAFDRPRRAILARSHMWEVPSKRYGHWNTSFPYLSALACTDPIDAAQGDKAAFLGRCQGPAAPHALRQERWKPRFGRHEDPIAALRTVIELPPGGSHALGFALAAAESQQRLEALLDRWLSVAQIERALERVRSAWRERLSAHRVETPEVTLNFLVNDWLRYQAIAGRLWGRAGYYQQSGAFGFRDQLQDSQVWLTIEPQRCREQIRLHAAHQFADGSVYHWWHPLTEQGHVTQMTDDLLWLAFVAANYIRETGKLEILNDRIAYLDDERPYPLADHVLRAFARVFRRTSPRGLPYIGAGDWNDGLSAAGLAERGESIWLGHFLAGLLADWAVIFERAGAAGMELCATSTPPAGAAAAQCEAAGASRAQPARALHSLSSEFRRRREALVAAINEHGWDGGWYLRATLDDGQPLGSHTCRVAKIFLNAQTWAVLCDVAPPDRAAACMQAVRTHLVRDVGALLLAPAFDAPDERIGYITRYAPGLRENGGVYTHAAVWAIAAACKLGDAELAGRLLTAIHPANKDPQRYWAEPYVLPGNVDGPESPYYGRAGWTWYTGSAAWLPRVVSEWVLGVRPEWDGLRIAPCLPPGWRRARMTRPWRGCTYEIQIERDASLPRGLNLEVTLDGVPQRDGLLPLPAEPGRVYRVVARVR